MPYSIYASSAGQVPGETIRVLDAGSATDTFIASLNKSKVLILKDTPNNTTDTPLDASDETGKWFARLGPGAVVSLRMDGEATTPAASRNISHFVVQFPAPWPMAFSSAQSVLLFTFGTLVSGGPRIPVPGIDSKGGMLTLGLDFTRTTGISTKVSELMKFAGLSAMAAFMPGSITNMTATLDKPAQGQQPNRNALWFVPGIANQTTVRLYFRLPVVDKLGALLGMALPGLTINSADLVCNKRSIQAQTERGTLAVDQGELIFNIECSAKAQSAATAVNLQASVEFGAGNISLTFLVKDTPNAFQGLLQWLASISGDSAMEFFVGNMLSKEESGDKIITSFSLRRIRIGLDTNVNADNPTLSEFSFDVEALASFGSREGQPPAAFLLSYDWNAESGGFGTLSGRFWNDYDDDGLLVADLSPYFEPWTVLLPVINPTPAKFIDLTCIIPGVDSIENIPDRVPTVITRAYLELSNQSFAIGGTITSLKDTETRTKSSIPQPYLGDLELDAAFEWGESKSFKLDLLISAGLTPSESSTNQTTALLSGALNYDSSVKTWHLKASLTGLYASTLAEFFDKDSRDHVMPLIDSIAIENITVEYTYVGVDTTTSGGGTGTGGTGKATQSATSDFTLMGKLLIASLELNLKYHYDKKGWEFFATLNPQDRETTIRDVIKSMLSADTLDLPDFIGNTKFVGEDSDALRIDISKKTLDGDDDDKEDEEGGEGSSSSNNELNTIAPAAAGTGDGGNAGDEKAPVTAFHLVVQLRLGDLQLIFAQLHSSDWGVTAPPKRLVKVALMALPFKVEVPLIGDLTQPFDQMYFVWVQDPPPPAAKGTVADKNAPARVAGLTRRDLKQLNTAIADKLIVKDKFKDPTPADLLLAAGCHVAVITKDDAGTRSCLITYQFMKPAADSEGAKPAPAPARLAGPSPSDSHALAAPAAAAATPEKEDDAAGPSATAPYKKKAGPLSISNIGLKYKNKKIRIQFDANFDLGPLAFKLMGFSIGVGLESLTSAPDLDVDIEGLACAFSKPPLTIAGLIRHGNTGELDYYAGGLVVGFVPYQFMAAGFYGAAKPKNGPEFTSVFVFAKLNGPLITLEFAEIAGITGGVGYNSAVRLPRPEQIADFPFVASDASVAGAENALEALQKLTDPGPDGWFYPENDRFWVAVGMKVTALQMIALDTVVMVRFGSGVQLVILAVAVIDIPFAKAPLKYSHVELGIMVVVDFEYGVFKAEAQLSPRSYIFHPDCNLTGGAALYYWFDAPRADPSLTGQFVFTLGGYHQAFAVPIGYPNPPRLAISWTLGKFLSIRGEAYFAITPKACMGGGRLRATFKAGPIKAWFDAFADFLINYKPFHFLASAGVSVGVAIEIDLWFTSFTLEAEVSARLDLWGPPLAGRVEVDLWVCSFTISFGDDDEGPLPVGLVEFYELVLQASESGKKPVAAVGPRGIAAAALPSVAAAEREAEEDEDEEDADEEIVSPSVSRAVAAPVATLASSSSIPTRPNNEGHDFLAQTGLMNSSDSPEKPPNPVWTVRGGVFSFVIGCKMAINEVRLDRIGDFVPDSDEDNEETLLVMTYGDEGKGVDVFGKPMRLLSPMSSTLTVQFSQDGVSGGELGWRFEEHVKSVPRGLWAKYNINEDPNLKRDNNIATLLNASDGSIPLLMGVLITAPPPRKSRDPFPVYNIKDASLQRLTAERPFPSPSPVSRLWEPAEPFSGDDQGEVSKQYAAVKSTWTTPGFGVGDPDGGVDGGGQAGFVSGWAKALGWASEKLSGKMAAMPKRVRNGFENMYVAAPLISV